ncbi:hypothetical protein ACLOJK_005486 [Asimina triloba]
MTSARPWSCCRLATRAEPTSSVDDVNRPSTLLPTASPPLCLRRSPTSSTALTPPSDIALQQHVDMSIEDGDRQQNIGDQNTARELALMRSHLL